MTDRTDNRTHTDTDNVAMLADWGDWGDAGTPDMPAIAPEWVVEPTQADNWYSDTLETLESLSGDFRYAPDSDGFDVMPDWVTDWAS